MVLVDTSVWVCFLRSKEPHLEELLERGSVVCHPFIVGELACGRMKNRKQILSLLQTLPMAQVAEHSELLAFIERHGLMGAGLGLVDIHLLAAAVLTGIPLWTFDRKLKQTAARLNVAFAVP